MKKRRNSLILFTCLTFLLLSLQGCLGIGDNNPSNGQFTNKQTGNGNNVGINQQAKFKGLLYFTLHRDLYSLDGQGNLKQLTHNLDVRDPAVSPDGKWIAFVVRYPNYADLVYMSTNIGPLHVVVSGKGQYTPNQDGNNTYYWFGQPAWSPDGTHLLFLSDLQKAFYWSRLGGVFADTYFLDLQIFSLPVNTKNHLPPLTGQQALHSAQPVAYAAYGNGGNRDPMFRPKHPDQIIFTKYAYDPANNQDEIIQLALEDPNAIVNAVPGKYAPWHLDPSVAVTPNDTKKQSLQPMFSPDGNSIAYIQRISATQIGLYIMAVPENVTNAKDPNDPAVVAKALEPFKKTTSILVQPQISQPVWSPDGKQIAFISYNNTMYDIWMINVTTDQKTGAYKMVGSPVQLTNAKGQLDGDSRPSWIA